MKKGFNRKQTIAAALILAVLIGAFFFGGNYSKSGVGADGEGAMSPSVSTVSEGAVAEASSDGAIAETPSGAAITSSGAAITSPDAVSTIISPDAVSTASERYSEAKGMAINPGTGKDKYLTDPVPEGKPIPVEPENTTVTDRKLSCTLSVRCDTILNNMKVLDPEKAELVLEDGVIFPASKVTFYEGESVFNVLLREMKKNKIHMEFVNTPIYNSAYIEGINNLYEFDCGELSGWMYKVNGWFPNYGCSRYQLKDGDVVEWVYTCDLGRDVGGYYSAGGTR